MADQVFRWGMSPSRPASPPSVGGGPAAHVPSGEGTGLLGGLANMAKLGMSVYDQFWGPTAAYKDLLTQSKLQVMEQRQQAMQANALKLFNDEYNRQVEEATGQKAGPELYQAFPGTRSAMMVQPGVYPKIGLATEDTSATPAPGAPLGTAPGGMPGVIARPNLVTPGDVQANVRATRDREAAALRGETGRIIATQPEGPARTQVEELAKGPKVMLPGEVAPTLEKQSQTNLAVTKEGEARIEADQNAKARGAMDRYRASGNRDIGALQEAMTYNTAGQGNLLSMGQRQAEFAAENYNKVIEAETVHKKILDGGDPNQIRRSSEFMNQMQLGHSRATGDPNVMIYSPLTTPGKVFGRMWPSWSMGTVVVPRGVGERYINRQMNPASEQDLATLAQIEMGVQPQDAGNGDVKFTPEDADIVKKYISTYPGSTPESRAGATAFIDTRTVRPPAATPGPVAAPGAAGVQPSGEVVTPGYEEQPPTPRTAGERVQEAVEEVRKLKKFLPQPPAKGPGYTVPYERQLAEEERLKGVEAQVNQFRKERGLPPMPSQAAPPASPMRLFKLSPAEPAVPPPADRGAPNSTKTGPNVLLQPWRLSTASPTPVRLISPSEQPVIQAAAARNGIDPQALTALRLTEMGGPGREFGVLSEPAPTYDAQANVAALSIAKSRARYEAQPGHPSAIGPDGRYTDDFLTFFSTRYAPPKGATNDPTNLNRNHAGNLVSIYRRLTGRTQMAGVR